MAARDGGCKRRWLQKPVAAGAHEAARRRRGSPLRAGRASRTLSHGRETQKAGAARAEVKIIKKNKTIFLYIFCAYIFSHKRHKFVYFCVSLCMKMRPVHGIYMFADKNARTPRMHKHKK